jgi:hypothetical protein
MEPDEDKGHDIEKEQDTYCAGCGHTVKAWVVKNGEKYVVVCLECGARGSKADSEDEAWEKWGGAGLASKSYMRK